MFILAAMMTAKDVIQAGGGPTAVARALDVRQSVVSNWAIRNRIPAERVLEIERITGVPCWEIRPDIFPPERFAKEAA